MGLFLSSTYMVTVTKETEKKNVMWLDFKDVEEIDDDYTISYIPANVAIIEIGTYIPT